MYAVANFLPLDHAAGRRSSCAAGDYLFSGAAFSEIIEMLYRVLKDRAAFAPLSGDFTASASALALSVYYPQLERA